MRYPSALLLVALATACSSDDDPHAPFKPTCLENCMVEPPTGSKGVPPSDAGTGGGGSVDGGVRSLSTNVFVLGDASFTSRALFEGAGTLTVQGPTFAVAGDFTGSPAVVANVEISPLLWVAVEPEATVPDVMRTLQPVDGRAATVDVDIARTSIMNDVLNGVTQVVPPPALDPERAIVVVTFVSAAGVPLPDIQIIDHAGVAVAYDSGAASYTDISTRTGPRGIGVVVNARPKPAFSGSGLPGGTLIMTYQGLAATTVGSFEVFAAPGSVTFATVRVTR